MELTRPNTHTYILTSVITVPKQKILPQDHGKQPLRYPQNTLLPTAEQRSK